MNEMISIIVPVYNVLKYLERCIESLLGQTYKKNEIILVDDGSTDGSSELCDEYSARYGNIKVVHKENAGLGYARNSGIDIAEGEYIVFVDSDDWVSEAYIEHLYKNLKQEKVEFCKSGFKRINSDGMVEAVNHYENIVYLGKQAAERLLPHMIGPAPEKYDLIEMSVCAVLYKLSIIREHDIRFFSERELISEDMVFNIDYLQYANGACTIDALDYNYIMNEESLTHRYRKDRGKATIYFYNTVKDKLITLGYENDTIIRLSRVLFSYLRMSVAQEKKSISHNDRKTSKAIIENLCSNESVVNAVMEYPLEKLDIKRRFFLFLVKKRCSGLLLTFANLGLL